MLPQVLKQLPIVVTPGSLELTTLHGVWPIQIKTPEIGGQRARSSHLARFLSMVLRLWLPVPEARERHVRWVFWAWRSRSRS